MQQDMSIGWPGILRDVPIRIDKALGVILSFLLVRRGIPAVLGGEHDGAVVLFLVDRGELSVHAGDLDGVASLDEFVEFRLRAQIVEVLDV